MANVGSVNKVIYDSLSPSSDFVTETLDLNEINGYSIQIICTGTMACTAKIGATCQIIQAPASGVLPVFSVLSGSTVAIPAGTNFLYNLFFEYYRSAQVQISALSGTGQLTIIYNAKKN